MKHEESLTIKALAECNMNVCATARKLDVDRDTVLYRCNRIEKKTGINPRTFYGLVKLLVGLKRRETKMSNECMSLPPIPMGVLVEDDPVENVMELVCEKCHHPYVEPTEDDLESRCDECRIEKEIRILLGQVVREEDFVAWDSQFEDSGE